MPTFSNKCSRKKSVWLKAESSKPEYQNYGNQPSGVKHKPLWNDTLKPMVLATLFGATGDDGGFQRFTAGYDWTDSIELTGGIVFCQSGDLRRTKGIGDNDRVYVEVQYNF
jgi:hypothetical protein